MRSSLFFILSVLLISCGHQPKKTSQSDVLERAGGQVEQQTQQSEMARIDREIRRLRAKDLKAVDEPQKRPLSGKVSEELIYADILKAYQSGDVPGLRFYQLELKKRFPQSAFADNSAFLVGKLLQKQGHLAKSLPYFQEVIDGYPRSNKRAAALLHKGMVYRELNLNDLAKEAFLRIKKEYRGSPEFFQVDMELRLLKLKAKV